MRDRGRPWQTDAGGLVLSVRLTPKGVRDAIEGIAQLADGTSVLKARVRALPSAGEANAALIKLIAGTLGVSQRDICLVAGSVARLKRVQVAGNAAALAAALEEICARSAIRTVDAGQT